MARAVLCISVLMLLGGGACAGRSFIENHLLFFPHKYPEGYWEPKDLEYEDAWFESADGVALHGWYVPHAAPRATVLLAHGNAGNLSHRGPLVAYLHQLGVSVLIFDYRGYGRSAGSPTEQGIYLDARAARDWLATREGLAPDDIVLHGRSLGTAVVVDVAASDGARGLILENAFDNAQNVALAHFPGWLVAVLQRSPLDSLGKLPEYHGPLLMIHSEQDEVVPFALGRNLFEAGNQPKTFVPLPGMGHNGPTTLAARPALEAFLDALPPVTR